MRLVDDKPSQHALGEKGIAQQRRQRRRERVAWGACVSLLCDWSTPAGLPDHQSAFHTGSGGQDRGRTILPRTVTAPEVPCTFRIFVPSKICREAGGSVYANNHHTPQ